jgi:glycine/D-amino acid oxidase-like deaminating enzyme
MSLRPTEYPVTDDFKAQPYWWDAAPRVVQEPPPLPATCDVAIVGSGLTGIVAALNLARGGRSVVVLDQGDLGIGASSRNAGYVGRTLKHGFGAILEAKGLEKAVAIYRTMEQAFATVENYVRDEQIQCGFVKCGRFIAVLSQAHYDGLAKELELRAKHLGHPFHMVPRAEQHQEVATTRWHGGGVVPDLAALHPGLYHQGLLDRARGAGAALHPLTQVQSLRREGGDVVVTTDRGTIRAREAIVATNGYTGAATPWQQRRVLPFNAFMVATEKLSPEQMKRILPNLRTVIDDGRNPLFVRPSPDNTRLLYGGHTGRATTDPLEMGPTLYRSLTALLPALTGVKLSHLWTGRCAGTWDLYPHIGQQDGIHYAMGYCFAGVPMGSYMGTKLAERILKPGQGMTVFDDLGFPPVPLHGLVAQLTAPVLRYWEWRDSAA